MSTTVSVVKKPKQKKTQMIENTEEIKELLFQKYLKDNYRRISEECEKNGMSHSTAYEQRDAVANSLFSAEIEIERLELENKELNELFACKPVGDSSNEHSNSEILLLLGSLSLQKQINKSLGEACKVLMRKLIAYALERTPELLENRDMKLYIHFADFNLTQSNSI